MNQLDQIKLIVEPLYQQRPTWGAGALTKAVQGHNFHLGGERTFCRAALLLTVPYVDLVVGGKAAKSYPLESALRVFEYLLHTDRQQRIKDQETFNPEYVSKILESRQQGLLKSQQLRAKKRSEDPFISIDALSKNPQIPAGRIGIITLCQRLNISIIGLNFNRGEKSYTAGRILKSDVSKLIDYIESHYSKDPQLRSREMSSDTIQERLGGYSSITSKAQTSYQTRAEQSKVELSQELGVEILTPAEATAYTARNNSTLIRTMKLLDLPLYKRCGRFLYDKNSLDILVNFFNCKNGLKGQLARAFERKLRESNYDFRCEKSFPDLAWKTNKPLRFDYWLPKYNLLIEVQGPQHFAPTTMGADITEEEMIQNFKDQVERDRLKVVYCQSHNLPLIIISNKEDFQQFYDYMKSYEEEHK